ncbi:MAG TPA: pilus assembly protein PilM [Dehalococcoidia bacterium]|nr:pilus assembly protein PilM [Dehalococcoidia bacterium]
MAKKVVTLFIRDDSVNLLIMAGKRVEKWASLPLEPGLVSQGLVVEEAQVANKLKELFKLEKIAAGRIIAGLSGHNSVYRIINLPELPEAVLPEAVKREAKRVIPVPLEEVYLSYQPLPPTEGETRLFLAAFPRNAADALHRTLHQAGLQPYIMDLAPLALCRAVNEPRSIIVNTKSDNTDIIVMTERIPQVIHRLSLPGEAESSAERLSAIAEEIDRTITFYNSSHQDAPLDSTVPMLVCGDLAGEPESWESLAGKSGCTVSVLPSPVETPDGFNPNGFMVNIGLALKELLAERGESNFSLVNLNTMPEVYRPKPVRLPNIFAPVALAVGISILLGVGFLVFNTASHTGVLRSELESLESLIAQETATTGLLQSQVTLIEPQITEVEATRDIFDGTFNTLADIRIEVNADVSQIVTSCPTEIGLTGVDHVINSATVGGVSPTEHSIFVYARSLRASGRFSTVTISSIEAIEEEGEVTGFEFEILLGPKE